MPKGCLTEPLLRYQDSVSKFIGQFLEQTTAGFDIFINGGDHDHSGMANCHCLCLRNFRK